MIPYEEMPKDNANLAKVAIDFPRLSGDAASSCPVSMNEVIDYLTLEGEDVSLDDLVFLRTAKVVESEYWIWEFSDDDDRCYVTVSVDAGGRTCIGYDQNWDGLTPEQFILGMYHNVF